MMYITRRVHFNAAHKLYNPAWSKAKNEEVFGKCANENWHGHNYVLFVTIKGEVDPETGYVTDAKRLHEIIQRKIVDQVDHKNLNLDVPFMKGKICSTENFAKAIWEQLAPEIKQGQLHCIKLYETENIYVEYFGD
ncbi:MAG: 6-carboxytetrahydropterin synthase [Thermoflavifilum sp.]|nr:6-carboxytetrahydropterin synthase [Thermoflavifilum sp.]